MRVVFIYIICLSILLPITVKGQNLLPDSVEYLQEVSVYAEKVGRQLVGNKLVQPTLTMQQFSEGANLNELLQQQANIQMKTYGNGMLSSIAFRGTTASQTSVLWNDFNINNYTLGQMDFSLLPTIAAEEVLLLPGGGSSFGGNGAIGGTIALVNNLDFKPIHKMDLHALAASYGKYQAGLGYEWANNRWDTKSQFYYQESENDFLIESIGQHQQHAAYLKYGVQQEIGYKLTNRQQLSLAIWYNHNEREIQGPIRSQNNNQFQTDNNFRSFLKYRLNAEEYQLNIGTGFFNDDLTFIDAGQQSYYSTTRSESFVELNWFPSDQHSFTAEVRANVIEAFSDGFNPTTIKEQRYTWQLKATGSIVEGLEYATHLGQEYVTNTSIQPLTPYLGLQYAVLSNSSQYLKLKANVSYNFRVPTLNDRFWQLDNREEILPENGLNIESGISYQFKADSYQFDASATAYKNQITNYIQWIPVNGQARPKNIAQVEISGLEIETSLQKRLAKSLHYSLGISYAMNDATKIDELSKEISYLVYVPKHKLNASGKLDYRNFDIAYFFNYSSKVYTTESNSEAFILSNYMLHDIGLSYQLKDLRIAVRAKNLLNTTYQTYLNYAMPGRNFELSINYKLNLR